MEANIPGALQDLGQVADRIAELIEWDKLAQQERRSNISLGFQPREDISQDIKALYGMFVSLNLDIHAVLDQSDLDIPTTQRRQWERRLRALETRVHDCRIMETFNKL